MKTSDCLATLTTAIALAMAPDAGAAISTLTARGVRVSDNKFADFVVQFDPAQTITQNIAPGFASYRSTTPNAIGTFTIAGQPSVSFEPSNWSVILQNDAGGSQQSDQVLFSFGNRFTFEVFAGTNTFSDTSLNNLSTIINNPLTSPSQPVVDAYFSDNTLPQSIRSFSLGTDFSDTSMQLISIPAPSSVALGACIVGLAAIRRRLPAASSVEIP